MSGYVASGRIERAAPRLARPDRFEIGHADAAFTLTTDSTSQIIAGRGEPDPDGGPTATWTSFRERWAQLTFFLFDPNSWR